MPAYRRPVQQQRSRQRSCLYVSDAVAMAVHLAKRPLIPLISEGPICRLGTRSDQQTVQSCMRKGCDKCQRTSICPAACAVSRCEERGRLRKIRSIEKGCPSVRMRRSEPATSTKSIRWQQVALFSLHTWRAVAAFGNAVSCATIVAVCNRCFVLVG